jgi:hypothetical protein
MACEYFIGEKKYTEQEFKDFLLKEGLDSFVEEKAIDLSKLKPNAEKDLGNKARELAQKIRNGEKNLLPDWLQADLPKGTKKQGIDINEAFASALETFADVYDKAKDFKKAVEEAAKHITDWYKENGIQFNEADIKSKLEAEFKKQIPQEKKPLRMEEKSILNRIFNSENISKEVKDKFKDSLKYKVASQEEARGIAKEVISEYGIEDAVALAEAGKFNGDINSMIFGEALDNLVNAESKAKTRSEKKDLAEQWADIAIRFDETARDKGRFISAISDFYKKSPLGIKIVEKRRRDDAFRQWFERNGKSYRDVFEEIVNAPEFKDIVKEEVQTELKKERVEYRAKRRKNIEDFFDKAKFKGDATYATIIPPQVINGGLEVMKQAFLAGESVLSAVEAAVKHISEKIGDDWDKDRFQKEYEEKLKSLDGGKKKEIDITEDKKIKLLDRFRKKLKGLTDSQKEEVIRKSFKKLVENGALEYEDFKKIIADTLGYGELTPEESARITELVNDINEVDKLSELIRTDENRSLENIKKYQEAKLKAERSATDLGKIVYNKPDIVNRLLSIMQLNTLGIPSLINNPIFNVFNQALVRFPIGVQLSVLDQVLYGGSKVTNKIFGTGILYPENNIVAGQKQFWSKLFQGAKQSTNQLITGLTNRDYFQKEVKTAQIHPFTSARELWSFAKGDKNLTKAQIIDKTIQATVGIPAETVARVLNIGDKPQRYAAEGSKAAMLAKQIGIDSKSVDFAYFLEFPKEEAYRNLIKKGVPADEAALKAENIQKAIIKEGEESTFQQDNLVNDAITAFAKPFGTAGSATKTFLMPFMKIPLNAYWSYFNLVNPEVAFMQSFVYGVKAYKSGSPLDLQEAKKWMAHGVTGIALMGIAGALAKQGIVNADDDDKTTKKERQGAKTYEQQKSINVTKLNAFLMGKDPNEVKNSLLIDSKWMGVMGSILNIQQSKLEEMTPEQKKNGQSLMESMLNNLNTSSLELIDNGVFNNTSSLLTAVNKGGTFADAFFMNLINMGTNIIQPAMFAQVSRAQLPYYSKVKADSFFEEVKNNMAARSGVIRTLSGHYPPSQVGIWGDTLTRKDDVFMKLFGMSTAQKDNFAQPIYEDYKRTGNTKFFPSAIKPEIDKVTLNTQEAEKLEILVGQARKNLAMPYFNDGATLSGFNKKYSELTDDEKVKALNIIYEQGYEQGKEEFYKSFPKYKPTENRAEDRKKEKESDKAERFKQKVERQ